MAISPGTATLRPLRLDQDRLEILISGFGGQGVIRMGQILGLAAVDQGLRVTMLKSHGTETRGGYVRAQIVISPTYVDSPVVEHADFFVAFSSSAYRRFYELTAGRILYDPEMVPQIRAGDEVRHLPVPATQLAKELFNNVLFANSIMLGALTRLTGLEKSAIQSALLRLIPRFRDQNVKAFELGLTLAAER